MSQAQAVDRDGVVALLRDRFRSVLGVSADDIGEDSRFDEDLHADSLDLVEVIEGVERELAARGVVVSLPDDELAEVQTVGEAADRIAARLP